MYILATQTLTQLISKDTLQQQRTHASYISLGTQTRRTDNTSYIRNPLSILPIKKMRIDRSSHIHRSTGTTRMARRCLPMNRVNKFHGVYLRL